MDKGGILGQGRGSEVIVKHGDPSGAWIEINTRGAKPDRSRQEGTGQRWSALSVNVILRFSTCHNLPATPRQPIRRRRPAPLPNAVQRNCAGHDARRGISRHLASNVQTYIQTERYGVADHARTRRPHGYRRPSQCLLLISHSPPPTPTLFYTSATTGGRSDTTTSQELGGGQPFRGCSFRDASHGVVHERS